MPPQLGIQLHVNSWLSIVDTSNKKNATLYLFADPAVGPAVELDLSDLAGKGVFALWRDRGFFVNVHIGSSGELAWDDKIDLCPDSLCLRVTGKEAQDIFPALKHEPAHA